MPALFQQKAFLVPFVICMMASAAILWYNQFHNPIRQFRPPFGQQLLIGVVLTMISGGISAFISSTILTGSDTVAQYKEESERKDYSDPEQEEKRRMREENMPEPAEPDGGSGLLRRPPPR